MTETLHFCNLVLMRKAQGYRCSLGRDTVNRDSTTVQTHNRSNNVKSQSHSMRIFRTRRLTPKETIKYLWEVCGIDAYTCVIDSNVDMMIRMLSQNGDSSSLGGVL